MTHSTSQAKSWTVDDLMKKSELIREGTPSLYHLTTARSNLDESGKIRKWTFGQREINTQNKIILLVGETGTGKTTLINAIVNYILGVKLNDDVWFEITDDSQNQTEDQTVTQTTEITVYEVFAQDNSTSVTIIDTPGFGDTRGIEHDEMIAESLLKLFKNDTGVNEIDAMCLVVKASQNRLSDRQDYIFDAILSLFGKDIEENIVIFVTHSDGLPPENAINVIKKAGIPCRKENGNDPVHFLFNNHQKGQWTPKYEKVYRNAWELTEESIKEFFKSLEDQSRKSLKKTQSVLTELIRLKARVSNLRERIEINEHKQEELTQIQTALKKNQQKIQKGENFIFKVSKRQRVKMAIENTSWWDRKATCCSVCEENCHESNCWFATNPGWCEVMKNGHCTVCTGKCHHSKHIRENKKYVTNRVEVTMTFTELIKRYNPSDNFILQFLKNSKMDLEQIKKQTEEAARIEDELKAELTKTYIEKTRLVEEVYNSIMKLSEIALKPDSAFMIKCLDFLIPRAEEAGRSDWVQKLKTLRETKHRKETPETQRRRVDAVQGYMKRR